MTLEPFALRDVPAMLSWNGDAEAQRWFDWPAPPARDRHEEHCRDVIQAWQLGWKSGTTTTFVVRDRRSDDVVGSVEIRLAADGRRFLSFLTHPEWRGRGLATRAVRLACRWAMSTLSVDEIYLDAAEDNLASRGVAAAAGFSDTGDRYESEPIAHYAPELGSTRTMVRYVLRRGSLSTG